MLENEKEINLNLKIPPEQQEGSFSMRELVLTIYSARKVFFMCCCIGLVLGIIAAAGYYASRTGGTSPASGEASVVLTLNYPGAEQIIFPNGADFNVSSFYDTEVWENALEAVGRSDVSPADAMAAVRITHYRPEVEEGEEEYLLAKDTLFELTILKGSTVFDNNDAKKAFLVALCEEYRSLINSKYFTESNIGILYSQEMRQWNDLRTDIIWDNFNFEQNFNALSLRYSEMEEFFESLHSTDPLFRSDDNRSFNDFADEFRKIRVNNIRPWLARTGESVYIRNIDRFRDEYQFQLDSMRINRDYSLELLASYNELLTSFQQKDTPNGAIVADAVEILIAAQQHADDAAELQKLIRQTEHNSRAFDANESVLRANSREAEAALTVFIEDLEHNQEEFSRIIFDYYGQLNERIAENSVIFTTPSVTMPAAVAGASMTRVLLLLAGLTFIGFAVGFCAAFVKKYVPEKKGKQ
jgi:hypothetical protein